jgi:hypothetical protein
MNKLNDFHIIYKICSTYNTSLINQLSEEGYKILINIINNTKLNKVKFKGLFTILFNQINPTITLNYDSYYGADLFVYMESKDHFIYLIGERHIDYKICGKSLADLIIYNLKFSTKFIDLFVESQVLEKKKITPKVSFPGRGNVLNQLFKKLPKCFSISKEECEYYGARIHYSDPRHIFLFNAGTLGGLLYNIMEITIHSQYSIVDENFKNKTIDILIVYSKELKKILSDPFTIKYNIRMMFNKYDKLNKNMKNISNSYIRLYIDTHLRNEIDKYDYTSLEYNTLLNNLKNNNMESYLYIIDLLASFMDVYLISRLFRGYRDIRYKNSQSAKHSIIVSGRYHTKQYIKMLTNLGFNVVYQKWIEDNGCIPKLPSILFDYDEEILLKYKEWAKTITKNMKLYPIVNKNPVYKKILNRIIDLLVNNKYREALTIIKEELPNSIRELYIPAEIK